jgi:hypothetical protein
MPANTIEIGPFAGWSYEQLIARRQQLIEQRGRISSLVGSNTNGQSYTFADQQAQLRFLDEESANIQAALFCLRPDMHPVQPPTNRAAIRLG